MIINVAKRINSKVTRITGLIITTTLIFIGAILGLASSIVTAKDNAYLDWLRQKNGMNSNQQLIGWALYFSPVIFALFALGALLFIKKTFISLGACLLMFIGAFLPFFYMAKYHEFSVYSCTSSILLIIASVLILLLTLAPVLAKETFAEQA